MLFLLSICFDLEFKSFTFFKINLNVIRFLNYKIKKLKINFFLFFLKVKIITII
jgi:hypothetical protein